MTVNNSCKKVRLTLTSHYYKTQLRIMMDAEVAQVLMSKEDPMSFINDDLDNVHYGYVSRFLSASQAKRIESYLSGIDYFDTISF